MGNEKLRHRGVRPGCRAWVALLVALVCGCAVVPVVPVAGPPETVRTEDPLPRAVLGERITARPWAQSRAAAPPPPGPAEPVLPAVVPAETPLPVVPRGPAARVAAVRPGPILAVSPAGPPAVVPNDPPAAVPNDPLALAPDDPAPVLAEPAGWVVPERPEIDTVLAEFTGPQRRTVARALERAAGYLPMIRRVLAEAELPLELACLPMVESHYTADARSHAEAVGLWQFIETTAQGSGLRVDWWVDERLDPELATRAAALHLQELHGRFGDWELALAAYNAGPGGVGRALERSGAVGFWALAEGGWLRAETRRYVPKFYAAVRIVEAPAQFGFEPDLGDVPREYDTVTVAAPVDLFTVARTAQLAVEELQRLNPGLKHHCTPPGGEVYPLRVPPGHGARVAAVLAGLGREERTDFLRYRVAAGDSLWAIARRFDTRPGAIAELNGVTDPRLLRPGQQLVVPTYRARTGLKTRETTADRTTGNVGYRVRPGDTVAGIARNHGVAVTDVLRWNGLEATGLIRPGDALFVGAVGGAPSAGLARARVHVVENGDTLWGISRRYGVSLEELRRANELGLGAVLRPGDELVVGVPVGSGG